MKLQKFYKLTQPDGFDFYTGGTINYRDAVGKTVRAPNFNVDGELCSSAFLHASRKPDQCFVGASIPCSAFVVRGAPILEDNQKVGFESLYIEKEVDPASIFKWNYNAAANPINPFSIRPPKIAQRHILLLKNWATVWATVGATVWDTIWDTVGATVWATVGATVGVTVGATVWATIGATVGNTVWDTVWDTVGDTVGATVWDTVGAYAGSLFVPVVKQWKIRYPFRDAVDLWYDGLVPSFDGKTWRLHGNQNANILYEEKI